MSAVLLVDEWTCHAMLWVDQVEGLGNMFAAERSPIICVIKMCNPAMGRSAPEVPVICHDLQHLVQRIMQREQLHLPRAVEQQVASLCNAASAKFTILLRASRYPRHAAGCRRQCSHLLPAAAAALSANPCLTPHSPCNTPGLRACPTACMSAWGINARPSPKMLQTASATGGVSAINARGAEQVLMASHVATVRCENGKGTPSSNH